MSINDVFAACMNAYLNRTPLAPLSLSAQEWGQLYILAKKQSLSGALFSVTDGMEMPDTVKARLRRDGFVTMTRYEGQQAILAELKDLFSAAQIAHLFFKGAVVRRYYAEPSMRTMGDIDGVVKDSDRQRADRTLTDNGYERVEESPEVYVYEKNGVLVEMHTVVRRYNAFKQETEPYEDIWTDARLQHEMTYRLSDEAEIVMTVAHLTAHFCAGGCGLRQLMDVAVLCHRFGDEDLWNGVFEKLSSLGLEVFAGRLLYLCRHSLGVETPSAWTVDMEEDAAQAMLERLLSDGTFGNAQRLVLSRMRKERQLGKSGSKVQTVLSWAFPAPDQIRRRYAYAKNPLLLPVGYAHRLVDGVTKHRRVHTQRLKYAEEKQEDLQTELELFELWGL